MQLQLSGVTSPAWNQGFWSLGFEALGLGSWCLAAKLPHFNEVGLVQHWRSTRRLLNS